MASRSLTPVITVLWHPCRPAAACQRLDSMTNRRQMIKGLAAVIGDQALDLLLRE